MAEPLDIDPDNPMHQAMAKKLVNYAAGQKMFDQKGRMLYGNKSVYMEFGDDAPEGLAGHTHVMHRETFNEMGGMDAARANLPGATIIHGARLFSRAKDPGPWLEKT